MEELVVLLQHPEKKEQAFRVLIREYQEKLYYHVRRYVNNHDDANDILQNTFIKVYRSIDNFRGECSLFSWLYKIAGNEAITYINKNKKRTIETIMPIQNEVSITDNESSEQIERRLAAAMATLPHKQQQVFILRYYDEMPYEKISEVLETSVGALKASYHHAVKKIEEFILSH